MAGGGLSAFRSGFSTSAGNGGGAGNGGAGNGAGDSEPLRRSRRRGKAEEWALALASQGLHSAIHRGSDGYSLRVADRDLERARQVLDAYDSENRRAIRPPEPEPDDSTVSSTASRSDGYAPGRPLAEVEHDHILRTLEHCDGNRSEAARMLGIGRNTLARKLRHD